MFTDYMQKLRQFHYKFRHEFHTVPQIPSDDTVKLRAYLISEEYAELIKALAEGNLQNISKELADLLYVVFGTAVSYGLPMDEIFSEVHQSNMSKSKEKNEEGKTMKGPDYKSPNIRQILETVKRYETNKEKP